MIFLSTLAYTTAARSVFFSLRNQIRCVLVVKEREKKVADAESLRQAWTLVALQLLASLPPPQREGDDSRRGLFPLR